MKKLQAYSNVTLNVRYVCHQSMLRLKDIVKSLILERHSFWELHESAKP